MAVTFSTSILYIRITGNAGKQIVELPMACLYNREHLRLVNLLYSDNGNYMQRVTSVALFMKTWSMQEPWRYTSVAVPRNMFWCILNSDPPYANRPLPPTTKSIKKATPVSRLMITRGNHCHAIVRSANIQHVHDIMQPCGKHAH